MLICLLCTDVRLPGKPLVRRHAQVLGDWVAERTLDEVLAAMAEARVPSGARHCSCLSSPHKRSLTHLLPSVCWCAGPILSTGDIMNEEQYHARGMFHEVTGFALRPILLCRAQM